ncbi:hypothetical protein OG194_29675 [Streptomyces sp. NBC_01288]|uniref:DUF6941 family protein n=1 Tax=Streptomyces sp. NBC_01288 TaxID=2903814 RepID=UPI002E10D861|nr:hypothetical protein OG194_29675 [Streptomyces sp. NBC_01288]
MKLNMAALCDRATVREGLLHILGAGVTQTSLVLPTAPDLDLAILIRAETWHDLSGMHHVSVTVRHEDGAEAGQVLLGWEAPQVETQDDSAAPNQPLPQLPLVVPLRSIMLTQQGEHLVSLQVDGSELAALSFNVTKAELPGVTVQLR